MRAAIASDTNTNVSAYVANATEFAARMTRLEGLERRNLDCGTAIELAKKTTWDDLSPKERRKALLYLAGNVLPGDRNSSAGARGHIFDGGRRPHRAGDRTSYFLQQRA